jgi:hypothetical protein
VWNSATEGELCSFDAFLTKHQLHEPALQQ